MILLEFVYLAIGMFCLIGGMMLASHVERLIRNRNTKRMFVFVILLCAIILVVVGGAFCFYDGYLLVHLEL